MRRASAGRKRGVSGSLSLPSRGPFHLSLTVLCTIGHWVVFSLGGWSPRLPTRFPVSRGTPDPARSSLPSGTGLSPSSAGFPKAVPLASSPFRRSITPGSEDPGLGSSAFARRYLRNRCFFLFLRVLRCFSSPGSPPCTMDSCRDARDLPVRVSPFGHPRIDGHLPLPAAFRSLSRPSSAPSAKASAPRSSSLDLRLRSRAAGHSCISFDLQYFHGLLCIRRLTAPPASSASRVSCFLLPFVALLIRCLPAAPLMSSYLCLRCSFRSFATRIVYAVFKVRRRSCAFFLPAGLPPSLQLSYI